MVFVPCERTGIKDKPQRRDAELAEKAPRKRKAFGVKNSRPNSAVGHSVLRESRTKRQEETQEEKEEGKSRFLALRRSE